MDGPIHSRGTGRSGPKRKTGCLTCRRRKVSTSKSSNTVVWLINMHFETKAKHTIVVLRFDVMRAGQYVQIVYDFDWIVTMLLRRANLCEHRRQALPLQTPLFAAHHL